MNALIVLFWVVVGLLFVVWLFGSFVYGLLAALDRDDDAPWPWRRIGLSAVSLVLCITAGIVLLGTLLPDDGSEHCGAGTRYVVVQDGKYSTWECVLG